MPVGHLYVFFGKNIYSLELEFTRLGGEGLWAEGSEYGKAKRADLVRYLGKCKSLTHPTELHHKRANMCVCIHIHVHPS